MKSSSTYRAIGLMSGTSLDGLDIVYCEYQKNATEWMFHLKACETITYSLSWQKRLSHAPYLSGIDLQLLDSEYGRYLGKSCLSFIKKRKISKVDFISSHGHTVFHQPNKKLTFQLGNGAAIHAVTGLPVVFDFRSLDVQKGGQGAPLVPIGDHLLFKSFEVCLNLGGIANLSKLRDKKREAFDICFVNMGLNYLAKKKGRKFDTNGRMASQGTIDDKMLSGLGKQYSKWRKHRPSLAREDFEKYIQPILDVDNISIENRLRTFCESVGNEIELALSRCNGKSKVLITGGGALNHYLVEVLKSKFEGKAEVIVPDKEIINFKEAIVFGFLGVLRIRGEINVLKEVTRASSDSCAGSVLGF